MTRHFSCLAVLLSAGLPAVLPLPGRAAPPASSPPTAVGTAFDIAPLKKALAPLNSGGLLLSSDSTMTGAQPGFSFTLRHTLQVTARRPEQFHADSIETDPQGKPQRRLTLVSNGVKVWTYQPSSRRYSVQSQAAFDTGSSKTFALGLVAGILYLSDGHEMVDGFEEIPAGDSATAVAGLGQMGIGLAEQTQTVNGQDLLIYKMTLTKDKSAFQFYVNKTTNQLVRIDFASVDHGLQITLRENITQISSLPAVPKSTFVFAVPPGAARTATITVGPQ